MTKPSPPKVVKVRAWILTYNNIPAVSYSDCHMDIFDIELGAIVKARELGKEVKVTECLITYQPIRTSKRK